MRNLLLAALVAACFVGDASARCRRCHKACQRQRACAASSCGVAASNCANGVCQAPVAVAPHAVVPSVPTGIVNLPVVTPNQTPVQATPAPPVDPTPVARQLTPAKKHAARSSLVAPNGF